MVFFFSKPDLIEMLRVVDGKQRLSYVAMAAFPKGTPAPQFASGLELPDLGIATGDASIRCPSYLVVSRDSQVTAEVKGDVAFVDQLKNPESVVLTPAGVHESGTLLFGSVGTAHEGPVARRLMNVFRAAVQQHSRKIKAFYVGPDAERLWHQGARLTVSLRASPEFDLTS